MNKIYVVNGEPFEVSPDREADFLAEYPNAELVSDNEEVVEEQPQEDVILESVKKTQGPAEQAAIVGPQNQEQPDTELPLEDTSSDLPKPIKLTQQQEETINVLKNISLTKEEEQEIIEKAGTTVDIVQQPQTFTTYGGAVTDYQAPVAEPVYRDYIKEAKQKIAEENNISIFEVPEQDWNEEAKNLWVESEKKIKLESKQEEALEEYEKSIYGGAISFRRVKQLGANALKRLYKGFGGPEEYLDFYKTKEENEYEKGRKAITEKLKQENEQLKKEFDNTLKSIDTHAEIIFNTDAALGDLEYKFNNFPSEITEDDVNSYNTLLNTRKTTAEIYNNLYNKLENVQIESNDIGQIADMTQRTYNNLDIATNRISGAFTRVQAGLGSVLYELSPSQIVKRLSGIKDENAYIPMYMGGPLNYFGAPEFKQGVDKLYEEVEAIEKGTKKTQELGKIKNIEDFGEFMLDLFTEQSVNTAITLGTGGYGLVAISASAAGNKFHEMELEMQHDPNLKISAAEFYGAGIMYGAAEYITERVSLGQAKKGLKYLGFGKKNFDKAYKLAGSKYSLENFKLSKAALNYGIDVNKEGQAELFAQLMNNFTDKYILDKDVSLTSGLSDAYLTGALMSGLGFQAPVLASDIYNAFSVAPKQKARNERLGKIFELRKKINQIQVNTKLNDDIEAQESVNAMQQEIDNLIIENIKDKKAAENRIDALTNSDKRILLNIEADTYRAKRGIDKINNNSRLDAAAKQDLIRKNQQRIDNNEYAKELVITRAEFALQKQAQKKAQISLAAEKGLEFIAINGKTAEETAKLGKEAINNSNLESDQKKKLKNEIDKALENNDVNGFFIGANEGFPITFSIENEAIANSAGSTILHETGHATIFQKLVDNDADMVELAKALQDHMLKNYKSAKDIFNQVEQDYPASEFTEAEIAEEKLAAALEYINDIDVSKDITLRNKLWQQWQKIKPPKEKGEITAIKTGEDVFNMLNSFVKGFKKGEFAGLSKKVLEGKITAEKKRIKDSRVAEEQKFSLKSDSGSISKAAAASMETLNKIPKEEFKSAKNQNIIATELPKMVKAQIAKRFNLTPQKLNEFTDEVVFRMISAQENTKFDGRGTLSGFLAGRVKFRIADVVKAEYKKPPQQRDFLGTVENLLPEDQKDLSQESVETQFEEKQQRVRKEQAEKAKYVKIKDSGAFKNDVIQKGKDKVLQTARTLKNKLNVAISKNLNTTPVVKEFVQAVAKQLDIDIKKAMGGKQNNELRNWTIKNKRAILQNATTTWLMGKDTGTEIKGGMPIAIEKSVGGKYTGKFEEDPMTGKKYEVFEPNFVPYPEWVGKKIDRERTTERGQTSGNELVRRRAANKIDDTEFANFVTTEDGTPIRGRKESLAKELAGELGVEIFTEEIVNPDSEISKAFETNRELRDETISDNYLAEINKQFERGKIKYNKRQKAYSAIGAVQRYPSLANELVAAWTQPTKTKRVAALKQVYSKLNQANENIANEILAVIKDGTPFLEQKIKRAWQVSEEKAAEALWALSKNNSDIRLLDPKTGDPVKYLKDIKKVIAGSDSTLPDILFEYKGAKIPLEIKAFKTARLGTTAMPNFFNLKDIKKIENPKTKEDIINNVYYQIAQRKEYKERLEYFKEIGVEFTKSGMKITQNQLDAIIDKYGSVYKATVVYGLDMPIEYVHKHYADKSIPVDYINFADLGLVKLGKNPLGLNVPTLAGKLNTRVYATHPTILNEDGTYTITPKTFTQLSTEAADGIAAQTNNSVYSIGTFNEMLKGVNDALIEAQKSAPITKVLNEKWSEESKERTTLLQKKKPSAEFNRIIERASGIGAKKKLSAVVARKMGKNKGMFKLFLPPSAEDFRGLYYMMIGKGKQGEADKRFFKENLVKPYTRGVASMEKAKQALLNDYKALRKTFKQGFKDEGIKMKQEIPGAKLSVEQAMRVYLWSNSDMEIPGLTAADQKKALEYVYKNPVVQAYADSLLAISKQEQWSQPTEYWDAQSILSDLTDIALNVNRKKYLEEFIENKNEIFSEDNLNKVEAAYGKDARQAIEDIMYRMETGSNKPSGGDTIAKKWNNWLNNSVGAIMFFNRRSATLQLLSTVNFMNTGDNNPLKAGLAFANQPQYWKDWAMIFNSPKLKERRGGLKSDVQEAEIAAAAKGAKNKPLAIISYLLKIGFTPTQIADSVAIASGGAAFYRNRVNTYKKQGFEQAEAEAKAFEDFSEISDETQQSGDPMLISKQQASLMGRVILAFQNTPMQITRFQKRDFQDLINRRRIEGKSQFQSDATYLSRIAYYTAVQNLIFSTLQNGLFTLLPGFDDEDEEGLSEKEIEKLQKKDEQKVQNVLNSMLDTTLRGSGLYGAVASTIKNVIIEYMRQQEKDPFSKDNTRVLLQAINLSPPLGSKARKIYNGLETMDYEKDVIAERGFGVKIDGKFQLSPSYQVLGNLTSAATNLPLDRVVSELDVVSEALDSRNTELQRLALALGWKSWEVGAEIEEHEAIKTTAKANRKAEGIQKRKDQAAAKRKIETDAFKNMNGTEKLQYKKWKRNNKGKRLYDYLKETDQL